MYEKYFKRFFDLLVATILFVFFIPVMFFIALGIRILLGKPILFIQKRPGKNERIFKIYKFRSMKLHSNNSNILNDEMRLTPFGRFLRKTSLDELPELWNVIKGEMSLVGPRPLLVEYLGRYSSEQKKRHKVRPGLTGLAQVNGRNHLTWKYKFKLDVKYVEEISFFNDLKILLKTFIIIFQPKKVNSREGQPVEKFKGNKNEK